MTSKKYQPSARLSGRKILIIGAASGIGRATAILFQNNGASIALIDSDETGLKKIASELQVPAKAADITDETGLNKAVTDNAEALGGIDGLVVTVGIGAMAPLEEMTTEIWQHVINVNLTGVFQACRATVPYLRKNEKGSIVTVASATGLMPLGHGLSAYAASKGGLITFTKAIAHELAPGIRVNTVCPGPVDTPLLPDAIREASSLPQSSYALGRIASAEEIANSILFLTADESSYITGIAMAVDGGRTFH
jgi:NAD(P)-dependent dehydrogenase (short-subunit alcohol dehydrogenase family)